jgi:hypothetical protein
LDILFAIFLFNTTFMGARYLEAKSPLFRLLASGSRQLAFYDKMKPG